MPNKLMNYFGTNILFTPAMLNNGQKHAGLHVTL